MHTLENKTAKRYYIAPSVVQIKLDNEITLVLESPPIGPGESNNLKAPEYFNNDPYKTNFG
ncbi:MAG: hypothetical protein WBI53_03825 [Paludibacter sp.]